MFSFEFDKKDIIEPYEIIVDEVFISSVL